MANVRFDWRLSKLWRIVAIRSKPNVNPMKMKIAQQEARSLAIPNEKIIRIRSIETIVPTVVLQLRIPVNLNYQSNVVIATSPPRSNDRKRKTEFPAFCKLQLLERILIEVLKKDQHIKFSQESNYWFQNNHELKWTVPMKKSRRENALVASATGRNSRREHCTSTKSRRLNGRAWIKLKLKGPSLHYASAIADRRQSSVVVAPGIQTWALCEVQAARTLEQYLQTSQSNPGISYVKIAFC